MRINSSAVAMQSDRSYYAFENKSSVSVSTNGSSAAILTFSAETRELLEHSSESSFNGKATLSPGQKKENKDVQTDTERAGAAQSGSNNGNSANGLASTDLLNSLNSSNASGVQETADTGDNDKYYMKVQVLKMLLMAMKRLQQLNAKKGKPVNLAQIERLQKQYDEALKQAKQSGTAIAASAGVSAGTSINASGSNAVSVSGRTTGTVWHKTTVESAFISETENTAFSAQGIAVTADGRQIGFNVSVEMTRAFEGAYESISEESYIVTDPLVINLDSDTVNVTDQKFLFDIDADGTKDEISFVGEGSGFLALDKNKDGVINDGSELFGTRSGNGFRDLAAYDKDKNGWIDEADDVFDKLIIWTKDENGEDKMMSLKEAGVGAIYLGSSSTEFSLNNASTNESNAIIRRTGIYLKENGEAGTVQHVDLVL